MTPIFSKCFLEHIELPNYYYEPIQIDVVQSGNYTLSSVDNRRSDIMGFLYKEHFSEYTSYERLILHASDGCPQLEFKIITELQSSVTYILIMTPLYSSPRDDILILISGPNNITFNVISKSNIELIISSFNRNFHQIFEQHIHQN